MLQSNFRVFNVKSLQKCFTREEVIFRVPFCFKKKKKKKGRRRLEICRQEDSNKSSWSYRDGSARFTDKLESEKKVIKEDRYPLNKNTLPVASSGPWRNGARKRLFVPEEIMLRERGKWIVNYIPSANVCCFCVWKDPRGKWMHRVTIAVDESYRSFPVHNNKSTLKISACGHLSIAIGSTNSLAKTLLQCYSIISEMIGTAWTKNEKTHQ